MELARQEKPCHSYRMVLSEDGKGCARKIEFEAPDALKAMAIAQQSLRERDIALFEDEHPLGTLRCDRQGVWSVKPAKS